jgi:hypothetical protein
MNVRPLNFFYKLGRKMTSVTISQKNMQRAQISMKRLYIAEFGENSISNVERLYSREELILLYAKNLKFWNKQLPDIKPGMTQFTTAKHAICSNAIEQLFKKCEEYDIKKQVETCVE